MSDDTSNAGGEPQDTTGEGVKQDASTPAEQVTESAQEERNAEEGNPLSSDELSQEFNQPSEVKTETKTPDPTARASHDLRMTAASNKVKKLIEGGLDDEEALTQALEEGKIKEDQANWLRKNAFGEKAPVADVQQIDPLEAARVANSEVKAEEHLLQTFSANKLDVSTAQAQAKRSQVISNFNKLKKSLSPREAADYALYKAGLTGKEAVNEAYESGQNDARQSAPPKGVTLPPSKGQPTEINEGNIDNLTAEQIKNISHKAVASQ